MVKHTECDKLQNNSIVTNNIQTELDMISATTYQKVEIEQDGMKIHFEFPEPTEHDECIKKEVKGILVNALQEQLKEIS